MGQTDMPSSNALDNTAKNRRKQSETKSHIDLSARIRREISKDDALSMTAEKIKIITIAGYVTLRGPVKTEQEKSNIEARTAAIAGSTNVDDQLKVAAQ